MRCQECDRVISVQALQIAMEQRKHFAMVRHAEFCEHCAHKVYPIVVNARQGSRFWNQSMNCAYCGAKLPIIRIRFELKDRGGLHVAVCQRCYDVLRPDLLRESPNLVTFIEKEWLTQQMLEGKRLPWPKGTLVKVAALKNRYTGQTGSVFGFRCLVQPWFGYHVAFGPDKKQFFHERDLTLVQLATPAAADASAGAEAAGPEASPALSAAVLPDTQPEPLPGPVPDFLSDLQTGPLPGMPDLPAPDTQAEPLPGLLLSLPPEKKAAPAPSPPLRAEAPVASARESGQQEPPPAEVPLSLPPAFAGLLRPRESKPVKPAQLPETQTEEPQMPEIPLSLPPAFASMLRPREPKPAQSDPAPSQDQDILAAEPPEPQASSSDSPPVLLPDTQPDPLPGPLPDLLPDDQADPLPGPLPDFLSGPQTEPLPGMSDDVLPDVLAGPLPDFVDLPPEIRIVDDEPSEARTES